MYNKLKGKDLITIDLYGVIYFVPYGTFYWSKTKDSCGQFY